MWKEVEIQFEGGRTALGWVSTATDIEDVLVHIAESCDIKDKIVSWLYTGSEYPDRRSNEM